MKLCVPDYYRNFACLADRCRHSCCIGWEIDIDEDTWDYYHSVEGDFGRRLKKNMKIGSDNCFILDHEDRCPFLNAAGLCDIYAELGEEALCEVCTEYPRFTVEYGDTREKSLSLSCEEVGRLLFSSDQPTTFLSMEIPGDPEEEPDEEDEKLACFLSSARDRVISLLQDRKTEPSVEKRYVRALLFAKQVQKQLNVSASSGLKDPVCPEEKEPAPDRKEKQENDLSFYLKEKKEMLFSDKEDGEAEKPFSGKEAFRQRLEIFDRLEVLDEEWEDWKRRLREEIGEMTEEEYGKALKKVSLLSGQRPSETENLLVYFVFRYAMKSFYDENFLDKIRLAGACYLCIRDMQALFLKETGHLQEEDTAEICRVFSREVEHSEDNVDELYDSFLYDEVWKTERFVPQILI